MVNCCGKAAIIGKEPRRLWFWRQKLYLKIAYHQVRILHEAQDDLVEYRSKVRFKLDRDPLSY